MTAGRHCIRRHEYKPQLKPLCDLLRIAVSASCKLKRCSASATASSGQAHGLPCRPNAGAAGPPQKAAATGDFSPFESLLSVLSAPHEDQPASANAGLLPVRRVSRLCFDEHQRTAQIHVIRRAKLTPRIACRCRFHCTMDGASVERCGLAATRGWCTWGEPLDPMRRVDSLVDFLCRNQVQNGARSCRPIEPWIRLPRPICSGRADLRSGGSS
jgi:hypothetical protein